MEEKDRKMGCEMTYYDKYRYLTTLDAVDDEDNWWIAGCEVNGIFRVNKQDKKIYLLKKSEDSYFSIKRYQYFCICMGKVYFLPMFSNNVEVYDIESGSFSVINISNDSSKMYGAIGHIIDGKFIYLFSGCYNETPVRINTDTMSCERIFARWVDIANRYKKNTKWFIGNITEAEEHIWYGVYESNILIKSSIRDLQDIEVIHLEESCKIYRVEYVGNNKLFVTMMDGGECIIYNISNGIIESKICTAESGIVINVLSYEKEIVLIPRYGKKVMLVNRDTGDKRIIDCSSEKVYCFSETDEYFCNGKMDAEKIYLYPYNTNVLTIINRKDMSISYEEWEIERDASTKDIMAKYVIEDKDGVYCEKRCDIDNFLENIIQSS